MKTPYAIQLIPALLSACSTIVHVQAQSAPGFPVQVKATQNLRVDFQSSNLDVDPAGALLQREDLLDAPTVQGPKGSTATLTFMLFMVDQDVTNDGQKQQLLHFFQPNLSGGSEVLFADQDADNFTDVPAASYLPPTPPAGDGPHRYTLLLYSQPQDFQVPNSFQEFFATKNSVRVGWDMAGFAEAAGLGDPVAANWFRVQNGDASTGSTATGNTGGASSSLSAAATATGGGGFGTTSASGSGSTVSTSSAKPTFSIVSTSWANGASDTSSAVVGGVTTTNDATPSLTIVTLSPTATTTTTGDTGSSSSATATATDATSPSGAATAASASGADAPSGATAAASSSSPSVGTSAAPSVSVLRWSNIGLVATSLVLGLVTGTELVMW